MEVAKGYKQTEIGVIPEDWDLKALGTILSFKNGVNADKTAYGQGVKFINVMEVFQNPIIRSSAIKGRVSLTKEQRLLYRVKTGDILFNRTSETFEDIAIASIYDDNDDVVYGGFVIKGTHITEEVYPFFTQLILSSSIVRKSIVASAQGAIRANIGQNELSKALIPLPPTLQEQQAIARVLSDTDALIQALEQKIAKKKLIKQGAMQELLRPKEGWENVRLQECLIGSPSYGINAPSVPLNYNLPAYLRITDITEDGRLSNDARVSVDSPLINHYFIKEGDIVFARTGASVGKTYLHNAGNGEFVYAGFLIKVSVNREMLLSEYLQYYTQSKDYWDWVQVMSQRSGQPGINGVEFGSMSVPKPPTIEEQEVICETLGSIDKEIHSLAIRKTKYQTLKQALMQQLLTGKIRLV